jgi:hypothetical protein
MRRHDDLGVSEIFLDNGTDGRVTVGTCYFLMWSGDLN